MNGSFPAANSIRTAWPYWRTLWRKLERPTTCWFIFEGLGRMCVGALQSISFSA
jgi:hypothetical protein